MPEHSPVDISIILPTYNERGNICDLIDAIDWELAPLSWRYELLVVDDNSPDGTADVVRQRYGLFDVPADDINGAALGAQVRSATPALAVDTASLEPQADPAAESTVAKAFSKGRVRLIVRTKDRGLAKSIRHGIEQARGRTLIVMDTDFNHDPSMIPQMVDLLRYYELVIGSRFVMRGGMEETLRYQASMLYNLFIRFLFHTQIQDNLSGFFAVRRDRLFEIEPKFNKIFYGYGDYFIRLLLMAWRSDWKILEVPVYYILRRHGTSKTGFWKVLLDYTKAVVRLRVFGI